MFLHQDIHQETYASAVSNIIEFSWNVLNSAVWSVVVGLISLLLKNRPGGNVAYVEKYLYLMRVADPESESDSVDIRRFTGMKTAILGFVAQRTQQYNYWISDTNNSLMFQQLV